MLVKLYIYCFYKLIKNKLQARIEYLHDFISKVNNYLFSLGYNFCENKIINQFREMQLCF